MRKNYAFDVTIILELESTRPDCQVAKIGLNGPMTNRVKVWSYFYGLTIMTNKFAFEVNAEIRLESTILDGVGSGRVGSGRVGRG